MAARAAASGRVRAAPALFDPRPMHRPPRHPQSSVRHAAPAFGPENRPPRERK